jgi:hypothetical protein
MIGSLLHLLMLYTFVIIVPLLGLFTSHLGITTDGTF